MAINYAFLVAAPMLQDSFVDKDGAPMANGTVTAYQDDNRQVLKNWYYQTGQPGNYNYLPLPIPLTLSSAGSICDVNGNDIITFYYPIDELDNQTRQAYFFVIQNQSQTYAFTRANFPYEFQSQSIVATGNNLENYIINNRFWRNIGSINATNLTNNFLTAYNTGTNAYYTTLAPSQHDSFSMPDINFIKDVNGAVDTITFNLFPSNVTLIGDIAPEYYINHNCTGVAAENFKVYQFPISLHNLTLSGQFFNFKFQAQAVSTPVQVTISIYKFLGTGQTSPAPTLFETLTIGTAWSAYTLQGNLPLATAPAASDYTYDDALYLQIGMPVNTTFDLNFALPSIYLSLELPSNNFQTYDQIDSIINTPRTGDIRQSLNSWFYFGWLPMNNGTIGSANSNATTRANADAWPLFNLLWTSFHSYGFAAFPIYTSAGANSTYGATAIADWNANKQLALTQMMGQVILGTVPVSALLAATATFTGYASTFTASNSSGLLITLGQSMNAFKGMPVTFSNVGGALPTGLSVNTIYYITSDNSNPGASFHVSTTFVNAMAGTAITWTDAGSGTNNVSVAPAGAIEGEYSHTQLVNELATHSHAASSGSFMISGIVGLGSGSTEFASTAANTATQGNSQPFNVTQPSTYCNIYIKL